MKYSSVVLALAGVAVADSVVGWETYSTPDPTTTSTWSEWDPKHPEPTETSTWSDWDPKKPHPPKPTETTDWNTWTSPSPTTTGKCAYETDVMTVKCHPDHPDQCWPYKTHTTLYADECTWSDWDPKKPYPPKPTEATTWADWNSWEVPDVTTGACSYETSKVFTKCWGDDKGKCSEYTATKTVYPTDCAEQTWAPVTPVVETQTWDVWDGTATVKKTVTVTKTYGEWETTAAVVTAVVKPEWSADGWFGPAWPTAKDGECAHNVLTSYGYPTWKPTPEATGTWSTWVKPEETSTSTWATWVEPEKETSTSTWATWTTPEAEIVTSTWATWAETATPYAPKPAGGKGHAAHAPNGKQWSITYTLYDDNEVCKTEEVIKTEIADIASKGFTTVRVYSTECHTLEYVGGACKEHDLKIILGVFLTSAGTSSGDEQVSEIIAWAQWEIVELIVIGNEAVFQGFCQPDDLAWYVKECKEKFAAAGYTGSCTLTEPLAEWQKDGSHFCEVVDIVAANLYAFFNADCTADKAGEFIQSEIDILKQLCPGKEVYVMESGWPSKGSPNGAACPGVEEQKTAIKSIQDTCGDQINFFSYANEAWKAPGQFGVEQYWGCADVWGDDSSKPAPSATSWSTVKAPAPSATGWSKW